MNKMTIARNAHAIWKILNENRSMSLKDLCVESQLPECDVLAAIGWLAHEDKIDFDNEMNDSEIHFIHLDYFF